MYSILGRQESYVKHDFTFLWKCERSGLRGNARKTTKRRRRGHSCGIVSSNDDEDNIRVNQGRLCLLISFLREGRGKPTCRRFHSDFTIHQVSANFRVYLDLRDRSHMQITTLQREQIT